MHLKSTKGKIFIRTRRISAAVLGLLIGISSASKVEAQQGDREGEVQKLLVPPEIIPPAPVLSPEEALKSFQMAPGFRLELVASEPLIHDPVEIEIDPDGRIWAVEMRGFMPNPDGIGEDKPVGNIVVLEDTNEDGVMDQRTVFQGGLVMPRALALVADGVLVAEPPYLWFFQDTDGDGKADRKAEVSNSYGDQKNPEHTANGLLWALDNWIYSANHTVRFRYEEGEWRSETTAFRGQWGIAQDNYGRLIYNGNSDQFRGDFVPARYLKRNPHFDGGAGVNERIARDQSTWPIRVTPGINRGYQQPMLRDGMLARFTAACGPMVYRGDQFPPERVGDGFVPEPSGNFIRHNRVTEKDGVLTAENAYDKAEFLASTDERFRPVNMITAPDGTLYVVDFYRGILQHRIYLTTYLRKQIEDRGLDKPVGLGRIYRIAHESTRPVARPQMSKEASSELVAHLSHPNGWWRDTAQRLLVERRDARAVPALRQLALRGEDHLGRLHALYTLDGMGHLDAETLFGALRDAHVKVRIAAMRLSEPLMIEADTRAELLPRLLGLLGESDVELHWQLAFTLGEAVDASAEDAMATLAGRHADNRYIRHALISGLGGREVEFVERLLAFEEWTQPGSGRSAFLKELGECVFREARPGRVDRLLAMAADEPDELAWRRLALIDGALETAPTRGSTRKPILFTGEPKGYQALARRGDQPTMDKLAKLAELITWPGQPGYVAPPEIKPLNESELKLFELGRELYTIACSPCHQPHGQGQEGLAPPLMESEWALGSTDRLVRIILHGVGGPITVKGKLYELEMPGLAVFDDEQIAAIATYVRREWGHGASPVLPDKVAEVRGETGDRLETWTEAELLEIP